MSITVTYDVGCQIVKSGMLFLASTIPDGYGWPGTINGYDPLLSLLSSRWFFCDAGARRVDRMLGFVAGPGPSDETLKVSREVISVDPNFEDYDLRAYGSIFRNLNLFGSVLTGASITAPSSAHETACRHITYQGDLISKQQDVPYLLFDLGFGDFSTKARVVGGPLTGGAITGITPTVITPLDYGFGSTSVWSFDDLASSLVGKVVQTSTSYGYSELSGFALLRDQFRHVLSWHCDLHHYADVYSWDASIEIPIQDHVPVVLCQLGNSSLDESVGHTTLKWYNCSATNGWDVGVGSGTHADTRLAPFFLSTAPTPSDVDRDNALNAYRWLTDGYLVNQFRDAVRDSYDDILPSSMFSTVDAFVSAEGSLGTNVLQDLQKIPQLASMMPQFKEAVDVLGRLVKRDLSFSTLKELLDLGTSTQLQASFQWRPFLALFTEYIPQLMSTFHTLGFQSKGVIGYGSFRVKLVNELGRDEVTLLTKTKVVMDSSPSGLLSAILGIDALGLLPKASNVWDLIPFTFVVNWFTGVGAAIKRAEYSLLLATIPAYFVHSYTITSPFSQRELDLLKMSSSTTSQAGLRLYYRDVSRYSPYPRDSRFGFGIPKNFPPLGVFGSLLYQLIFG